jgi:hypothetical protein
MYSHNAKWHVYQVYASALFRVLQFFSDISYYNVSKQFSSAPIYGKVVDQPVF